MPDELALRTITSIAPDIRAGTISPVELTEYMLQRIEARDGELKSYATVMADEAMQDARRCADELAKGMYRGPLHGVPFTVKESFYVAGTPATIGLTSLQDDVSSADGLRTVPRSARIVRGLSAHGRLRRRAAAYVC